MESNLANSCRAQQCEEIEECYHVGLFLVGLLNYFWICWFMFWEKSFIKLRKLLTEKILLHRWVPPLKPTWIFINSKGCIGFEDGISTRRPLFNCAATCRQLVWKVCLLQNHPFIIWPDKFLWISSLTQCNYVNWTNLSAIHRLHFCMRLDPTV